LPWQPFLAFYIWGAHWRHLKNTTEPSVCGGDVISNYFDHLFGDPTKLVLGYVMIGRQRGCVPETRCGSAPGLDYRFVLSARQKF